MVLNVSSLPKDTRFIDPNPVLELAMVCVVRQQNGLLQMGNTNMFEHAKSIGDGVRTRHECGAGRDVNGPDSGSVEYCRVGWCCGIMTVFPNEFDDRTLCLVHKAM
jgi:hypothetical protein